MTYQIMAVNDRECKVWIMHPQARGEGMYRVLKLLSVQEGGTITGDREGCQLQSGIDSYEFHQEDPGKFSVSVKGHSEGGRWRDRIQSCLTQINQADTREILDRINEFLEGRAWFDFRLSDYNGLDLYLVGSTDLSYYHELEIVFENASFILCSSEWSAGLDHEPVFSLAEPEDHALVNSYDNSWGYSVLIKMCTDDSDKPFYIGCYGIHYSDEQVFYHGDYGNLDEKEKFLKKYDLKKEGDSWYQEKENSHKHLIFKDYYYRRSDVLELVFRYYKLCIGKLRYFREHLDQFEPYKYHYRDGFVKTELWDSEFLRHRTTGYMIDYRYLQSITRYEDFIAFCEGLQ